MVKTGGGGGIRTHERRKSLPVFKTGAFNRSATPPNHSIYCRCETIVSQDGHHVVNTGAKVHQRNGVKLHQLRKSEGFGLDALGVLKGVREGEAPLAVPWKIQV